MRHLVPFKDDINELALIDLFNKYIASNHGLPYDIFFDRGPLFTSAFWNTLTDRWNIER